MEGEKKKKTVKYNTKQNETQDLKNTSIFRNQNSTEACV
jgi:hypothetical protein